MGRPRKDKDLIEQEIDQEMSASTEVIEEPRKEERAEVKLYGKAHNEFSDEYTLVVDQDFDKRADIFRIPNPDPRFQYRWLSKDEKTLARKNNALLTQYGGWQLATAAHAKKIGRHDTASPDGLCRIGEHVLAFMPKELYEKKLAAKQERTDAQLSGIQNRKEDGSKKIKGTSSWMNYSKG